MKKLLVGLIVLVVLFAMPLTVSAVTEPTSTVQACIDGSANTYLDLAIDPFVGDTDNVWELANGANTDKVLSISAISNGYWTASATSDTATMVATGDVSKSLGSPLQIETESGYTDVNSAAAIMTAWYDQDWDATLSQPVDTDCSDGTCDKILDSDDGYYSIVVELTITNSFTGSCLPPS